MKKNYIARLAVKNLSRYKRRTLITALVLSVGIGCYILIDSMLIGVRKDSEINLILYEMGDGRIVTSGYWDNWKDRLIDECIEDPDQIVTALNERGIAAVKRIEFETTATLQSGIGGNFIIPVTAIDMKKDSDVLLVTETLTQGRFPENNEDGVVMGEWMAQDLEVELGELLNLKITDRWGSQDALELEIVGILNTPNPEINRGGFFITLETADYYLDMEGAVTQIVVDMPLFFFEERKALKSIEEALSGSDLEYHPWQDWSQDYISAANGDKMGSAFILILVFIIASVGLANTTLMTVMERQREIGMMRSMGMDEKSVRHLFLWEAGIIGLIGSLAGVILGALFNIPLVNKGIDYSTMMRDLSVGYRITGIMRGVWTPTSFIYSMAGGILICVFVSWFTVRKIVRRSITDEIRST